MITALLIVLGAFALVVIAAALQPSKFRVTREAVIAASPDAVFSQVNNLPKWQAWSPWERLDPAMQRTFAGPSVGVGAVYGWSGNNKVGSGRMTIEESRASASIRMKLEFFKPMACTNQAEFTFTPAGNGTLMIWSMSGTSNLMGKIFCLFMNMDKMVGGQFEEGLANLKKVTEPATRP